MTARTRLCRFVIDVPDLDQGVAFWTEALDAVDEPLPEIRSQVYRHLRLPDTEIAVLLQKTNDKKASKERMHLDIEAGDVEAGITRLEALGATRWDHQQERGFDFWVMRDPWENEFCILQSDDPNVTAPRERPGGESTTAHMTSSSGPATIAQSEPPSREPTTARMANYSMPLKMTFRANFTKWLIFGVLLPLLPLTARLLAALLNPLGADLSFTNLFGDGELLIIATVIAAAVIGDLLFEISAFNDVSSRIRAATLSAVALLIVVVSVLTYGLIAIHIHSVAYIGSDNAATLSILMFVCSYAVGSYAVSFSTVQRDRIVRAEPST